MTQRGETRTRSRRRLRPTAVGLLVVATAVIGTLVHQSVASTPAGVDAAVAGAVDGAVDAADGVLPDDVTVFDNRYPGVADLDPDLLRALREAATEAADDGVTFYVNSGWRSRGYQNELLSVAVSTYGSESAAARWVATADTSPHVSGEAVDIGKDEATAWLSRHGAKLGLCQIYVNEPWHYELRPAAREGRCPPMYADPTHDPRMQP